MPCCLFLEGQKIGWLIKNKTMHVTKTFHVCTKAYHKICCNKSLKRCLRYRDNDLLGVIQRSTVFFFISSSHTLS